MGSLYYDWVSILRGGGCTVQENSITAGWQRRARSSGGFAVPPIGIWWHHTASPTSMSVNSHLTWQTKTCPERPVGNMLLDRSGTFWPIAGGASNCAGKGGPWRFSKGNCPKDQGNVYGVQIEVENNGLGEPWSQKLIDEYFRGSLAIAKALSLKPDDIVGHAHYAPTRKIDPAQAGVVQGPWKPRSINGSGTWNLDDMKAECTKRAGSGTITPPKPQPDDEEDSVFVGFWMLRGDPQGAVYSVYTGGYKIWMPNQETLKAAQALATLGGKKTDINVMDSRDMFVAFGPIIGPAPSNTDQWGCF